MSVSVTRITYGLLAVLTGVSITGTLLFNSPDKDEIEVCDVVEVANGAIERWLALQNSSGVVQVVTSVLNQVSTRADPVYAGTGVVAYYTSPRPLEPLGAHSVAVAGDSIPFRHVVPKFRIRPYTDSQSCEPSEWIDSPQDCVTSTAVLSWDITVDATGYIVDMLRDGPSGLELLSVDVGTALTVTDADVAGPYINRFCNAVTNITTNVVPTWPVPGISYMTETVETEWMSAGCVTNYSQGTNGLITNWVVAAQVPFSRRELSQTNLIGNEISSEFLLAVDTLILACLPYYYDEATITTTSVPIAWQQTNAFRRFGIGDLTNQWTAYPTTEICVTGWPVCYTSDVISILAKSEGPTFLVVTTNSPWTNYYYYYTATSCETTQVITAYTSPCPLSMLSIARSNVLGYGAPYYSYESPPPDSYRTFYYDPVAIPSDYVSLTSGIFGSPITYQVTNVLAPFSSGWGNHIFKKALQERYTILSAMRTCDSRVVGRGGTHYVWAYSDYWGSPSHVGVATESEADSLASGSWEYSIPANSLEGHTIELDSIRYKVAKTNLSESNPFVTHYIHSKEITNVFAKTFCPVFTNSVFSLYRELGVSSNALFDEETDLVRGKAIFCADVGSEGIARFQANGSTSAVFSVTTAGQSVRLSVGPSISEEFNEISVGEPYWPETNVNCQLYGYNLRLSAFVTPNFLYCTNAIPE